MLKHCRMYVHGLMLQRLQPLHEASPEHHSSQDRQAREEKFASYMEPCVPLRRRCFSARHAERSRSLAKDDSRTSLSLFIKGACGSEI